MITDGDINALLITLTLAMLTTIALFIFATPLAWWLSRTKSKARIFIEPIIALPIVLPPTVLGFYLLILFSPNNFVGHMWLSLTGRPLAFTFTALVIASVIYSLPFYVQPLQIAFEKINQNTLDTAATLGASPLDRFFSVVLPLSRKGFVISACLAFAHTIGEFGIVLMIGGNIPGETQVLSIALFDHVESQQYAQAHWLAGGLVLFSLILLTTIYAYNRRRWPL